MRSKQTDMFPISLDPSSAEPKYRQIMQSVIQAIDNKELQVGDKLSSINQVCANTGIAKKTVVQAFEQLKKAGIIYSVQYKGYFVASRNTNSKHNIFVLFNKFTAYKEEIYESIQQQLGDKGIVDIYFHHDNLDVFNTLVEKSAGKYTEYIIMPLNDEDIGESLARLPQDRIYILDLGYRDWGRKYPSVCQFFEEDIYEALQSARDKVKKYRKIVFVPGKYQQYRLEFTLRGIIRFCNELGLEYGTMDSFQERVPEKGCLYIVVDDSDLVYLVKSSSRLSLETGGDIGIISYNETAFKEIIGNGIATISTDFTLMGSSIIRLILEKDKLQLRNPSRLIERNSF